MVEVERQKELQAQIDYLKDLLFRSNSKGMKSILRKKIEKLKNKLEVYK